jgi:hypothetical protein
MWEEGEMKAKYTFARGYPIALEGSLLLLLLLAQVSLA